MRSSATAEDLPGASFAGQQDTFLNVRGDEALIKAISDCWASLWSERAVAYRRQQRIDDDKIAMAVVVQKMIQSEVSGVCFTVHPVTQDRNQMIIEAGWGLGEAVYLSNIRFKKQHFETKEQDKREGALIFLGDMIPIDEYSYFMYRYFESDVDGIITVMEVPNEDASSYGVVTVDENSIIQSLVEKPKEFNVIDLVLDNK